MGLRAVFHNLQIVSASDLHNGGHVGCLSVQMDYENRFCPFRNFFLDAGCVDIKILVRFYEDRGRAVDRNSHNAGDIGVPLYDHLIAFSDSEDTESDPERIQAAGQPHAVFCTCKRSEFPFKSGKLPAQYIPAGAEYLQCFLFKLFLIKIKASVEPVGHYFVHMS